MAEKRQALRMPGRVYEALNQKAQQQSELASELDICEALAAPRLKRRGGGFTALVFLDLEQVGRLMYWISDRDPKLLRDYKQSVRAALREAEGGGSR